LTRRLLLVALALAAVALAACGERKEPTGAPPQQHVRLMLDYFPNADHAGIYAAKDSGAFSRAGLDVQIQTPSDPAAPLKLLAAARSTSPSPTSPSCCWRATRACSSSPSARSVQKPLTSIISIGKHAIAIPAELKGKTVGTAGIPYQSAYLKAILSRAAVGPVVGQGGQRRLQPRPGDEDQEGRLPPSAPSGTTRASSCAWQKQHPQIIRMENVGVPTYQELVIVARQQDLGKGGERVRRFVRALGQGHAALRSDPAAGVQPLLKANPDLDPKLQLESVKATLPVFFPAAGKPFGWMDKRRVGALRRLDVRHKLLSRPPNAARALTRRFLPGQGLADAGSG
jgi:putative hydroxymethylpyrimidine transport system substrate-binding protein